VIGGKPHQIGDEPERDRDENHRPPNIERPIPPEVSGAPVLAVLLVEDPGQQEIDHEVDTPKHDRQP
jgi:hypothetical protein